MTLTRERPTRSPSPPPIRERETGIPPPRPDPPRPPLGERVTAFLMAPISRGRAFGVWLGWLALFGVALAVEPVPADPGAMAGSAYEILFPLGLLGAMGAMFVGLARQRRWGLVAGVVASGFVVAGSVVCLTSGHHAFGAWWPLQMGAAGGALGLTAGALRGSRARAR